MDRIDLFRIFVRLVECGSFTRTADMLGLSRSSVSVAIQALEARMGVRLLNRTTRRVAVTHEGSLFYERCRAVVADVEEAEALFRPGGGPRGQLRVDLPGRIGRLIVAPRLPEFLDRHPGITVSLGITDRTVDLLQEAVDCVLRVGPLRETGRIVRTVGLLPLINVASPAYLDVYGVPRAPADLVHHRMVRYASPSTGRVEGFEWVAAGEIGEIAMEGRVTVNSAEAQIACCLAGLGLIQIPAYDVQRHLARGELVEILPSHRAEPLPMNILFPDRRTVPHRAKIFADWLEGLMREFVLG